MHLNRLQELELTPDFLVRGKVEETLKTKKVGWRFLKGPIPWGWLCKASRVSEKSLHVAIGLWFISGMTKKPTVKMQKSVLEDLGVSRHAFYRARDKMEEAGLISVEKKPGQTHLITLLVAGKDPQPNRRPSELKLLARNTGMKRTIN